MIMLQCTSHKAKLRLFSGLPSFYVSLVALQEEAKPSKSGAKGPVVLSVILSIFSSHFRHKFKVVNNVFKSASSNGQLRSLTNI